jgi:hypothetical protein
MLIVSVPGRMVRDPATRRLVDDNPIEVDAADPAAAPAPVPAPDDSAAPAVSIDAKEKKA